MWTMWTCQKGQDWSDKERKKGGGSLGEGTGREDNREEEKV